MNTEGLQREIDKIIELIYECNFNKVIKNTLEIVENVEKKLKFCLEENEKIWKQIMQYLLLGLENKDYLVVADILKYELKPILKKENQL